MRLSDYQEQNFSQAQEEAGAAVTDALIALAVELGIEDADGFAARVSEEVDAFAITFLGEQEAIANA